MTDYVFSVGGSVVSPRAVNHEFVLYFVQLLTKLHTRKGNFVLVAGGGFPARNYIDAGKHIDLPQDAIDRIAIAQTKVNAQLLYEACVAQGLHAHLLLHPSELRRSNQPTIFVLGGTVPGHTTDYVAVEACKHMGIRKLINISNVEGIYSDDPKKDSSRLHAQLSWSELQQLVGTSYEPGAHVPFDPVATNLANGIYDLEAYFVGSDIENLNKVLHGESFVGTYVQ